MRSHTYQTLRGFLDKGSHCVHILSSSSCNYKPALSPKQLDHLFFPLAPGHSNLQLTDQKSTISPCCSLPLNASFILTVLLLSWVNRSWHLLILVRVNEGNHLKDNSWEICDLIQLRLVSCPCGASSSPAWRPPQSDSGPPSFLGCHYSTHLSSIVGGTERAEKPPLSEQSQTGDDISHLFRVTWHHLAARGENPFLSVQEKDITEHGLCNRIVMDTSSSVTLSETGKVFG